VSKAAKALALAARPKTLTAAVAPVIVGTALARAERGVLHWWLFWLALVGALAIQIGTNLFNDLLDFRRGTDTTQRLGPLRATQAGLLTERQVFAAGMVTFAIAIAAGIPLVIAGGVPILVLGIVSLACGYAYTGGPYPLAYNGLGELFVIAFFGLGAVGGMYYLHTGTLSTGAVLAGVQVGFLASALLAVNNLRDVAEDRNGKKATLAVRFGVGFGRFEIFFFCIAPFVLNAYWYRTEGLLPALLPVLTLPLAVLVIRGVYRHAPGPAYNRFLAQTAALHLGFSVLLAIGLTA